MCILGALGLHQASSLTLNNEPFIFCRDFGSLLRRIGCSSHYDARAGWILTGLLLRLTAFALGLGVALPSVAADTNHRHPPSFTLKPPTTRSAKPHLAAPVQGCPPGLGQGLGCTGLESYVYTSPAATTPLTSGLRIPVAPSPSDSSLLYIPGNILATLNDQQTLTNKTINCLANVCVNFPATGITALTGPVTGLGPGSVTTAITPTGVTPGSYTCPTATVNAAGQVTSIATGSCGSAAITQLTGAVVAGPGSGSQSATIVATGVTAGTYTCPTITVNASGQITSASNGSCGGGGGTVALATGSGQALATGNGLALGN